MASVGSEDGDSISLNIMPMLDIFSILILFLLMSFSTEPVSHDITEGVELPESNTLASLDEVPAVRVAKNSVVVNDKTVATLVGRKFSKNDTFQGAVYPVFKELEKLSIANKRISKKESNEPMALTLEIDKNHEFIIIKKIMKSAQQVDFVKFKLMVAKNT